MKSFTTAHVVDLLRVIRCLSAFKLIPSSTATTSVHTCKSYAIYIKRNTYNIQKKETQKTKMHNYIQVRSPT